MIFRLLALSEDGVVTAKAEGHASEVVVAFHDVVNLLLSSRGPWRITDVAGTCPDSAHLDSEMEWTLIAKVK